MKNFDFAVLIGRFQPFHSGHLNLFKHALSIADHVIIIIGSHNSPESIHNPWDSKTRESYIRLSLTDIDSSCYTILFTTDSAYNFNDWVMRVQKQVSTVAGKKSRISLVGHFKDDSSYYLSYFPQWRLEILPTQAHGISSTDIRNACFEGNLDSISKLVAPSVYNCLKEWLSSEHYNQLLEEYQFIKNYRQKWENSPVPPTFVTAEAVVLALGHVLIIKRKFNPGKGRFALPGGFVKQTETIEQTCLRELKDGTDIQIGHKELMGSIKMNHVFDHPTRDPRGRVITHAFMINLNVKDFPKISACDIASDALWHPLYKLEEIESNFFCDHSQIIKFFINRMH